MIGLVARRTLGDRPRRTAMLLVGLGIAVGVMITLLSIGDAVLEQSRDKDIVGGGDLVLLPAGLDVEVMKVGGATGMYFTLDNARYLVRQVLCGPRFAARLERVMPAFAELPLAAASPALVDKVVYVRKTRSASEPLQALAHGFIPSLDRAVGGPSARFADQSIDWPDSPADGLWADPPADVLYNDLDRFHLPNPGQADIERWGEWLYFNFTEPHSDVTGYVSFIATNDLAAGAGRAVPLLHVQAAEGPPLQFAADLPLALEDISLQRVDLRFGADTRATFRDGAWRLRLQWQSEAGPVRGELTVTPLRDLYFPPFVFHESERFVSGYTVPALRASVSGWITAPGVDLRLDAAPGYHDHNWGTWRQVHWDWGTSSTEEYALLYGRVRHPELRANRAGDSIFLMLSQARAAGTRGGLLGLFRPSDIEYDWESATGLPGQPARVPTRIRMRAGGAAVHAAGRSGATPDSIHVVVDVTRVASTPPNEADATGLVFLQVRGTYTVTAHVAGSSVRFTAPGFAEVFVPSMLPDAQRQP